MDEPQDTGDLLEVPEDEQLDTDPDPQDDITHAALADGVEDLSDVPEGDDVDDADLEEN